MTLGLFAISLTAGIAVGLATLAPPAVSNGNLVSKVQVWVSDPDTQLVLSWELDPDGTVSISLARNTSTGSDPVDVILLLSCDARMQSLTFRSDYFGANEDQMIGPQMNLGDPGSCQESAPMADRELEYQLIELPMGSSPVTLEGRPVIDWTAVSGGLRVARTPSMGGGDQADLTRFPELVRLGNQVPEVSYTASLLAGPWEIVETLNSPPHDEGRSSDATVYDHGKGPRVVSQNWLNQGSLAAGLVSWSDPNRTGSSQWLLLVSGGLLGLAAALLADFIIDLTPNQRGRRPAARGEETAQMPPAPKTGARTRGRPRSNLAGRPRRMI